MTERGLELRVQVHLGLLDGRRGGHPHGACNRHALSPHIGYVVRRQLGEIGVVGPEEFRVVDAAVKDLVELCVLDHVGAHGVPLSFVSLVCVVLAKFYRQAEVDIRSQEMLEATNRCCDPRGFVATAVCLLDTVIHDHM